MPSRLSELSSIIADNTAIIDDYNIAHNLPSQSFDADALLDYRYPPHIEEARWALIHASDELHDLMAGPFVTFQRPHHLFPIAQQMVWKHGIANAFPKDKATATYAEIAQSCGLDQDETRRIVRLAMTNHIFRQTESGDVAHTAASKLLADSELMQQFVGMVSEELFPTAALYVPAQIKWPSSQEPNQTGFNLAHNTDKNLFQFLADKPERAKRFADSMSVYTTGPGFEIEHLLSNYPWASLGQVKIVDIGGSHGLVSKALVERFPNITAVVQDLPEVVAGSLEVPPSLNGRLEFQAHDFFTTQHIKDGDVYLFRWIFHDWSDKYAAQIIKALVPALKDGARVIVQDTLMPEPGEVPLYVERLVRTFDLAMATIFNGKEREVAAWTQLFTKADPRFTLSFVKQPPLSRLGIIEFTFNN